MRDSPRYEHVREDEAVGGHPSLLQTQKLANTSLDDSTGKATQSNSEYISRCSQEGLSLVEFQRNLPSLVAHLTCILQDKELYRKLVGCQLSDAQRLLDSFQQLLDSSDLNPRFRKSLSVATQRISAKSGSYPACYELKDVAQQGEYPVNAGGFADIYKGMFQGRVVCLKTFRLYQTDQIEHMLKATSKEAILWRQLLHPNVLTLFGLYRFRNRISLVTMWMENGDINVYLKKNPAAPRQRL
ncbi:hypothetical protein DXG01_005578, partial [Tephrocybe rancida]